MILAHCIKLDPTVKQARYFAKAAGTARLTWNWALAEWREQYGLGGKPKASELKRYWNAVKYEKFPWLKTIHRDAHAQPFANLQVAFKKFFKKEGRYPRFKKKGLAHDSFYVACDKLKLGKNGVRLPVVGFVKMRESLRFSGKILSATVSREADRWYISVSVEMPELTPEVPAGAPIGVDLGLTTFAALSTGEKIEAPKPLIKAQKRLRRRSRSHSRKQLDSNNRRKSAMKLARLHRRIKNIRKDFLHKLSTKLSKTHSQICVEDLNVKGMVKNHNLARHISDAAWGEFRRQLEYKTRMYGSTLTVRDRFFPSSKTCSDCGHKVDALPLSVREWACPQCGALHDRDVNAAKNLVQTCTERCSETYASGDCGADRSALTCETAVIERGTTTVGTSCSLTP